MENKAKDEIIDDIASERTRTVQNNDRTILMDSINTNKRTSQPINELVWGKESESYFPSKSAAPKISAEPIENTVPPEDYAKAYDYSAEEAGDYSDAPTDEDIDEAEDKADSEDNSEEKEVTEEEYQEYLAKKRERAKEVKKKNRHRRTFAHILGGVLLSVFIISISSFLAVYIIKSALDFTGIGKTYCQAEVVITEDSTTDDIAQQLANLGIINMPDVFKMYTHFSKADDKFIKGTFTVDTTMSYSTLLMNLQTVSTANQIVQIQITEGMRIDEIAELLEENLVCRADDFLEQCKTLEDTYKFQKRLENKPLKYYQMEGYIFPDTYEFYIIPALEDNNELDTTEYAQDVLDIIYQNFNNKLTARYYNRMSELGLTLDETITLASIVQREADSTENMGNVASVFFNRMAYSESFPHLESDVTVHYVDEQIKPHLQSSQYSANQKMFDAYNTYVCDGIPVGPICNPGLDAIKAVLYAPETDYFYFCADPETTEMYFAETISEHEENLRICGLEDAIAE